MASALDTRKKIHRASLLLMGGIFLSRLIGFVREWVLAQTVGASRMTDVYLASFTLPDFLNYLVATGALSISFIPILSEILAKGDEEAAKKVFRALSTYGGLAVASAIILAEIFTPWLSPLVAPGFSPEQFTELTLLIRLILPAQFFFFWGGLAISVQHTHGTFFIPTLAPIAYNFGIIALGLLLYPFWGIAGFSIGVTVGSLIGNGLIQWWGVHRLGFSCKPLFKLDDFVKRCCFRYLWLSLPIMLGFSIVVSDEWISKFFASFQGPRAISWLSYARTEMRIPLGVLAQVAGIASFPFLARLWNSGSLREYVSTLLREIEKMWAVGPLAAIILINHALPATHFIYGGGKLTQEDLMATAEALQNFGIGLFFWMVQLILSRGFYAAQRTWLPSIAGSILSVISIPIYFYFGREFGTEGLALAGSISIGLYVTVLWVLLKKHLATACPDYSYGLFYRFIAYWCFAIVFLYGVSKGISALHIYQYSRLTGLAEVLLASGGVAVIGLVLLRKVYARWTEGPLF